MVLSIERSKATSRLSLNLITHPPSFATDDGLAVTPSQSIIAAKIIETDVIGDVYPK